jgi:SET domain-containing protein
MNSTDTKCDTEGSRACEEFNATFNYVAPCLKTDCHQKAHIYDDQGNHCELNDIKQFLTKKLEEQKKKPIKKLEELLEFLDINYDIFDEVWINGKRAWEVVSDKINDIIELIGDK